MNYNQVKPQSRKPPSDEEWMNNDPGMETSEDIEEYLEEIIMDPQFFIF